MKAWVLDSVGQFNLKEVDKPKLTFGETLVNIKAVGICGSDIPRVYVNGAHKMPLIPGHEMAGEVVCAPGPKAHWNHKRVGIFPLIPCMKCEPCKKRKYEMCRNYDYLGSRSDGGFAEYVVVPAINLIEIPDNVSYEAAAMLEPMAVAVHAMRHMGITKDDKVVVAGLGTIGLLLCMFLLGTEVVTADNLWVVGNKNYQKELATKLGIKDDNYLDAKEDNIADIILNKIPNGPDVFFECVGKNENVSLGIDVLAPSGRLCTVGNPHSDMTFDKNTYWKILRNQLTVKGTWNSSFTREDCDDWHYALDAVSSGKINPEILITHKLSMDDLDKGFAIMRDKTEDYIKIMMVN